MLLAVVMAFGVAGVLPVQAEAASVSAPTSLKATNLYEEVKLTWKESTKGTTFRIYVKGDDGYKAVGTTKKTKYLYKKVKKGKTYTFKVTALKSGSSSATSKEVKKKFTPTLANLTYSGKGYVELKDNQPEFTADQLMKAKNAYITFGNQDRMGRCTAVIASVSSETLPTEERGDISSIHPSGWQSGQGWERCHLLAYSLGGGNANPKNFVTGTHQLNVTGGMWVFENQVLEYVRSTGYHVLYRVTPVFKGKEKVCRGVQMEARSIEGSGIEYNVYIFNVESGEKINYKTGFVSTTDSADTKSSNYKKAYSSSSSGQTSGYSKYSSEPISKSNGSYTYVVNENSMKFHYKSCSGVSRMSESNRKTVTTTRVKLIQEGYSPCGMCEP